MDKPSAHKVTTLAQQAISHLQIQIDAIQDVLVETGHLKLKDSTKIALLPHQPAVPENIYFTPMKMKTMVFQESQVDEYLDGESSPTLDGLGLSTLSMSLMGNDIQSSFDSPAVPKMTSFNPDDSRDSMDTLKSFDLKLSQRDSVDTVKSFDLKLSQRDSVDALKCLKPAKAKSDPNSLFNDLINLITQEEFQELPPFLTAQLTRKYINNAVSGICF